MTKMNKVSRFQIEDLSRKGWRSYVIENKNMDLLGRVLYYRFYLDNFHIGKVMFVKSRKPEE